MKKFTVSENVEIVADGKRILLEAGDMVVINEAITPNPGQAIKAELYEVGEPLLDESDRLIRVGYFRTIADLKAANDVYGKLRNHSQEDWRWKPISTEPISDDMVFEELPKINWGMFKSEQEADTFFDRLHSSGIQPKFEKRGDKVVVIYEVPKDMVKS